RLPTGSRVSAESVIGKLALVWKKAEVPSRKIVKSISASTARLKRIADRPSTLKTLSVRLLAFIRADWPMIETFGFAGAGSPGAMPGGFAERSLIRIAPGISAQSRRPSHSEAA